MTSCFDGLSRLFALTLPPTLVKKVKCAILTRDEAVDRINQLESVGELDSLLYNLEKARLLAASHSLVMLCVEVCGELCDTTQAVIDTVNSQLVRCSK